MKQDCCPGCGALDIRKHFVGDEVHLVCLMCGFQGLEKLEKQDLGSPNKMFIPVWKPHLKPEAEREIAYQERNLLALKFAEGWYIDKKMRGSGWERVLSLCGGGMTFHIPDWFEVGNLPEIDENWDGHTTEEKWQDVLDEREIEL